MAQLDVGHQPREPVLAQRETAEIGGGGAERMDRRADIVPVARLDELERAGTAAGSSCSFDDPH